MGSTNKLGSLKLQRPTCLQIEAPLFSTDKVFYQEYETRKPNRDIVPTPTFVLSFDAIIGDAEKRNHTFLEILKAGIVKGMAKAGAV
jgi:hypothetical protein